MPRSGLSGGQSILVSSLLFGLFFGAGNLIFPVELGRAAGRDVTIATLGFLLTAVGLPIVGVIASAVSHTSSVLEIASRVGRRFGVFFTCALYLTIGPLFAIPRTATVSYEVGVRPLLPDSMATVALAVFSVIFLGLTALFAMRPGKLIDWIGKYLNPAFLISLSAVLIFAVITPMTDGPLAAPTGAYATSPLVAGLLDGYGTMDALGSLAFAVLVIDSIHRLGVRDIKGVAVQTGKAGVIAGIAMSVLYGLLAFVGATSLTVAAGAANGGAILAAVSRHYFGPGGQLLMAAIVFFACLKTAIGLTTACAEMFAQVFPDRMPYDRWVQIFAAISLGVANIGLAAIVKVSVPVLMFLYPIAIALILLALATRWLQHRPEVYRWTIGFVCVAAVFDALRALPASISGSSTVTTLLDMVATVLPGLQSGFGWMLPAVIGATIGVVLSQRRLGRVDTAA
ncbi:Branched-chain amino acid transport system 2 carrier protein [Austwickia sp. TVS 96-490-7B]|nr:Branched-chain amino acid transport system 2 carrier protein [Austwickia sp. TVS 96-490-7B]